MVSEIAIRKRNYQLLSLLTSDSVFKDKKQGESKEKSFTININTWKFPQKAGEENDTQTEKASLRIRKRKRFC